MGVEIPEDDTIEVYDTSLQFTQCDPMAYSEEDQEPGRFCLNDSSYQENGETKQVDTTSPEDFADEWPGVKKTHAFYFMKYQTYEDPDLKKKMAEVDKDIKKLNQVRVHVVEAFQKKKAERATIIDRLRPLNDENIRYKKIIGEKRKELDRLQDILEYPLVANVDLLESLSSKELDVIVKNLHCQLNHEILSYEDEKILVTEINVLEYAREKLFSNNPIIDNEEATQDKIKIIKADIHQAIKEQIEVWKNIMLIQEDLKPLNGDLCILEEELKNIDEKKSKAVNSMWTLRKSHDEINSCYYINRSLLSEAKELAANKNIEALKSLANVAVDSFMLEWSSNKALREDYERRILYSLDCRELSRDGRMRNPDEKPIFEKAPHLKGGALHINEEVPHPNKVAPAKTIKKLAKNKKSVAQSDVGPVHKVAPVRKAKSKVLSEFAEIENELKLAALEENTNHEKISTELSDPQEIDDTKLREIKREEEIAKAKLALERKKRHAEKVATKAAIRAQKEAEKKFKEKVKRAKKKGGGSLTSSEDSMEMDISTPETPEKETVDVLMKNKDIKKNLTCSITPKNSKQVLKAILKRRRSQEYWSSAVLAAIFALVVAICYFFFFDKK